MNGVRIMESGGDEKRRKRVLTDARKEQNRIAQRAYRQRQREGIQNSQRKRKLYSEQHRPRLLYPRTKEGNNPLDAIEAVSVPKPSQERSANSVNIPGFTQQISHYQRPVEFDWLELSDPGQVEESNPGELTSFLDALFPNASTGPSTMNIAPSYGSVCIPISNLAPDAHGNPTSDVAPPLPSSLSSQMTGVVSQTIYSTVEPVPGLHAPDQLKDYSITPSSLLTPPQASILDPQDYSLYLEKTGSRQSQNKISQTSNISFNSGHLGRSQENIEIPSLPDPCMNNIRPTRSSIFTGALHNARCLGITLNELMTSRQCSPFYRPSSPADDPKALLAAASNPSFPAHLQPTLPQILFPHHAYIDLLPFPVLRARAITLSLANPQLFKPMDLKLDIIMHEGIVCRLAGNAAGQTTGQPWDMRTWEVAPWFLKKWRILLVSEDDKF